MTRALLVFGFSFGLFLSSVGAASADTVHGKVSAPGRDAVAVVVYDEKGMPYPNTLVLRVDGRTKLEGAASADQLRKGDPVRAEVSRQATGLWRADAIRLLRDPAAD